MATYNGRTVTALGFVSADPFVRALIRYADGSYETVKYSDISNLTDTEKTVIPTPVGVVHRGK